MPQPATMQLLPFDALDCPSCGGNYLHQGRITHFERDEDDKNGHIVELKRGSRGLCEIREQADASMIDCPSPRRHGLRIDFHCETCSAIPSLKIYQHKGQTFMEWAFLKWVSA
jgi:hypothetical protein